MMHGQFYLIKPCNRVALSTI